MNFNIETFNVKLYDQIIARGLSDGIGERDGQMCIEAAICTVLDLPHGDDPGCVAESVRAFKIRLNDAKWSSAEARANGLRDLGLAQLGSLDVVDDSEFAGRLSGMTIQKLIPALFRECLSNFPDCLAAANRCEAEGAGAAMAMARAAAMAAMAKPNITTMTG